MTLDEIMAKLALLEERLQSIEKSLEAPKEIAFSNVPFHVHRYDPKDSRFNPRTGGPEP